MLFRSHADLAIDLIRAEPGVRGMFQRRIDEHGATEHGANEHGANKRDTGKQGE